MPQPTPRHSCASLIAFADALLQAAGMPPDKAAAVADILVDGDLMGHTTHGLQLLPSYLRELENKSMQVEGEPEVVAESPATLTWDGRRLPGPWLVLRAMKPPPRRRSAAAPARW
jgi:LDH2 family malate/lactate/ureidoglycolate dehydrogenase